MAHNIEIEKVIKSLKKIRGTCFNVMWNKIARHVTHISPDSEILKDLIYDEEVRRNSIIVAMQNCSHPRNLPIEKLWKYSYYENHNSIGEKDEVEPYQFSVDELNSIVVYYDESKELKDIDIIDINGLIEMLEFLDQIEIMEKLGKWESDRTEVFKT